MNKRNDQIVKFYNSDKTLQSIGDYFNISRQRVWQIISISNCKNINNKTHYLFV